MKELELKPTPLGEKAWMGRTDVSFGISFLSLQMKSIG